VNTARKGRRLEHRSRALLEAARYTVIRAAASKGDWDLVAYSATDWVLVQVKAGRAPSPLERQALAEAPVPPHTRRLLHRWKPRQRLPDTQEL
jgi:Holliday junction resolvase-like predicted endonuclease